MLDENILNLFIALLATVTTIMFGLVTKERRYLKAWFVTVVLISFGSVFIYLKVFNSVYRVVGNLFYVFGIICFDIGIVNEYYRLQPNSSQKKLLENGIFTLSLVFVGILSSISFPIFQIHLLIFFLSIIGIILVFKIFKIKKTPRHGFIFLSSICGFITVGATISSSFSSIFFWELSYFGNILFLMCLLATTIVIPLEERLIESETEYMIALDKVSKQTKELEVSEANFQELTDSSMVSIFIIQDDEVKYVNETQVLFSGYTREEIETMTLDELMNTIHPEDVSFVINQLQKKQYGKTYGISPQYSIRVITKDGEMRWVDIVSRPIVYNGKPANFITMIDITARKKIEEELIKREQTFRRLFEDAPFPLMEFDFSHLLRELNELKINKQTNLNEYFNDHPEYISRLSNSIILKHVNHAALKLFEIDEISQWSLHKVGGTRLPFFYEFLGEVLNGSTEMEFEGIGQSVRKNDFHTLIKAFVVPNYEEELSKVFVAIIDITNIKKMEEALIQSETRYRTLYQTARVGLVSTDLNGKILSLNQFAVELLGYENTTEIIGKNMCVLHKEPKLSEQLRTEILKVGYKDKFELPLKKKDGSTLIVEIGSSIQPDENNNLRIESVLRDITEFKRAEKVRKELEEKQKEFISLTQHELRTPLTISSGWCEYLLKCSKEMTDEKREVILFNIRKSLARLERLIEDVRTATQLDQNFFHLNKGKIEFCEFIKTFFRYYNECLGDSFIFKGCSEELIIVEGDKTRLRQVLDNLIDNALKHTSKDNRQIFVEMKTETDSVQLLIHDNGSGIRTEDLEVIFNKYVSIPTDNTVVGTGLGLYISREILKAHGGTIKAKSEGRGHGSTFIITLPCTAQPESF
jgi:PAS domain S-box-containing protein